MPVRLQLKDQHSKLASFGRHEHSDIPLDQEATARSTTLVFMCYQGLGVARRILTTIALLACTPTKPRRDFFVTMYYLDGSGIAS